MNKTFIVDRQEIHELVISEHAKLLAVNSCADFCNHVNNNFKWDDSGNRIDWNSESLGNRFYWPSATEDEVAEFINETTLSRHKHVGVIYGEKQPGLIVTFDFARHNVDLLTYYSPGLTYIVGLTNHDHKLSLNDFIEIDSGRWISGFMKALSS